LCKGLNKQHPIQSGTLKNQNNQNNQKAAHSLRRFLIGRLSMLNEVQKCTINCGN
jgi:hypothetical protein